MEYLPASVRTNTLDGVWKAREIIPMDQLKGILEDKVDNFKVLFSYPEASPTHYQLHDKIHDVGIIVSLRGDQFGVVEDTYNRHHLEDPKAIDQSRRTDLANGLYDHKKGSYR